MKEKLKEIYDGLIERLKSPFILTFLIVWSIHHWDLLFHLFSFDENTLQSEKFKYIKDYIDGQGFENLLMWPIVWTVVSFLGYLIAALFFESITEIYERWGRPFIYYCFNRNKVINRDLHEKLKKEYKALSEKYDAFMITYDDLAGDYDTIVTREGEKDDQIDTLHNDNTLMRKELDHYKLKHSREDNYIHNHTREAVLRVLHYFSHKPSTSLVSIKIQSLLLGQWKREEFDLNFDPPQKTSDHHLVINNENVTNEKGEFLFNVIKVSKYNREDIFLLEFKNKTDMSIKEMLFKVTNELYIGRNEEKGVNGHRFIEYSKIK